MRGKQTVLMTAVLLCMMSVIFSFNGCDNSNNGCGIPDTTPTPTPEPGQPSPIDDGYHQQRMTFVNVSGDTYLTAQGTASSAAIVAESTHSQQNHWVLHRAGNDTIKLSMLLQVAFWRPVATPPFQALPWWRQAARAAIHSTGN